MTTMMKAVSAAKKKLSDLIEEDRGVAQQDPMRKKAVADHQVELRDLMMRATTMTAVTLTAKVGAEQRRKLKLRPRENRCQTSASHLLKRTQPLIVGGKVVKMMMTKAQVKIKQKPKEVFHRKHRKAKLALPQRMTLNLSLHLNKRNQCHQLSLSARCLTQTQYQKRLSKVF